MNKVLPILLFLLLLVTILLSYWYFFPNSQSFYFLSRSEPIIETIMPQEETVTKQSIIVVSKIEDINIQLKNEIGLRELLVKLNFWGESAVGINKSGSINWTTSNSLQVIVVPEKQPWGGIYSRSQQGDLTSFNVEAIDNGMVNIKLWVAPDQASEEAKLETLINKTLLIALFDITHWTEHSKTNIAYIEFLNLTQENFLDSEENFPIKIVIDNNK